MTASPVKKNILKITTWQPSISDFGYDVSLVLMAMMICCWRPRGLCTNSLLLFTHNNNKNKNSNNDNVLCSLLHDKAANETNIRPPFAYPDDRHQHRLLLVFIFFFAVYWVSLLFVGIALVVVFHIVVVVVVLAWSFIYNICMLLSSFVSPHSPGFARSFVWGWEFCFAIFFSRCGVQLSTIDCVK